MAEEGGIIDNIISVKCADFKVTLKLGFCVELQRVRINLLNWKLINS